MPNALARLCRATLALVSLATAAHAEPIFDLNDLALRVTAASGQSLGAHTRSLAVVHVAAFDAADAIDHRYANYRELAPPPPGASAAPAALGAGCAALVTLYSAQRATIDKACAALASALPANDATTSGWRYGESVGRDQVAARSDDGAAAPSQYRPVTAPGVYVPTVAVVGYDARTTRPWALRDAAQFRPGPPPELASALWARDYNEVKAIGSAKSVRRTEAQGAIASFWLPSGAVLFNPLLRHAAAAAGPAVVDRARIMALGYIAAMDAAIAVFDAKYVYNFWRPLTAIRNGDIDDNPDTERDPGWMPMHQTPMHPEYPCAHCIASAAMGEVMASVLGSGEIAPLPISAEPGGTVRTFRRISDFVDEVSESRICAGFHYRNSTEVGVRMGRQLGQYVVENYLRPVSGAPRR